MTQPDYYEILQVSPKADEEVIQAAYKRLALKYHPDRNHEPTAHEKMQLLNEAYETLSDPQRRQKYDQKRRKMSEAAAQQKAKAADGETPGTSSGKQPEPGPAREASSEPGRKERSSERAARRARPKTSEDVREPPRPQARYGDRLASWIRHPAGIAAGLGLVLMALVVWLLSYVGSGSHAQEQAAGAGPGARPWHIPVSPDALRTAGASLIGSSPPKAEVPLGTLVNGPWHTPAYCWDVAVSPDGTKIAAACGAATSAAVIPIWDVATGKEAQRLQGHTRAVRRICFSPDGAQLLSSAEDNTLRLWNVRTAALIHTFVGHTGIPEPIAISGDGTTAISAGADRTIRVWDLRRHVLTATLLTGCNAPDGLFWLPGDKQALLCCAGTSQLAIWRISSGLNVALRPPVAGLDRGCVTRDGRFACCGAWDGHIRIWDLSSHRMLRDFSAHKAPVGCVAASPSGRYLASGGTDHTIAIWDFQTGAEIKRWVGHAGGLRCITFTPDGNKIVSGGWDGTVRVWQGPMETNAAGGQPAENSTRRAAVDHEAPRAPEDPISFALSTGTLRCGHSPLGMCFSPDGKWLAAGIGMWDDSTPLRHRPIGGAIILWDAQTGRKARTIKGLEAPVTDVCFSPDGRRLVTVTGDPVQAQPVGGTVAVWEMPTGRLLFNLGRHPAGAYSVCFNPNGTLLATGGGTARVWNLATRKEAHRLTVDRGGVWSVAFSPDGRYLAAGAADGAVRVWDWSKGAEVLKSKIHQGIIRHLAFSADGARLITCSRDGTVKVLEVHENRELLSLSGSRMTDSLALNPSGDTVVAGGWDGRVRIWHLPTGKSLSALDAGDIVTSLCFDPRGTKLAVGRLDGVIQIWHAGSPSSHPPADTTAPPASGSVQDSRQLMLRRMMERQGSARSPPTPRVERASAPPASVHDAQQPGQRVGTTLTVPAAVPAEVSELLHLLEAKNSGTNTRVRAVRALGAMGPKAKAASRALCTLLFDRSQKTRLAAAQALDQVNPAIHDVAIPLLVDPNLARHSEAVARIIQMGPAASAVTPVLLHYRAERNGGPAVIRALAAAARQDETVTRLFARWLIREERASTRLAIVRAFPTMAGASAHVEALITSAKTDPSAAVRAGDAWALGMLGVALNKVVPLLHAMRNDRDAAVRDVAKRALEHLHVSP